MNKHLKKVTSAYVYVKITLTNSLATTGFGRKSSRAQNRKNPYVIYFVHKSQMIISPNIAVIFFITVSSGYLFTYAENKRYIQKVYVVYVIVNIS